MSRKEKIELLAEDSERKNCNIVIGRKWRSAHDAVDKKTPLVYYILVADSTYR